MIFELKKVSERFIITKWIKQLINYLAKRLNKNIKLIIRRKRSAVDFNGKIIWRKSSWNQK